MAKEGIKGEANIKQHYIDICNIVDGDVSAEVISTDFDGMVKEGEELAALHPQIVVKVPIIKDGIKAIKYFSDKNIRTNCTLVFSPGQALLAAKAGATYVSPFIGRLDDNSTDGLELIDKIVEMYNYYEFETQVLAASIRNTMHIIKCVEMGADVATCPLNAILGLLNHPLTDIGLEKFLADYKKSKRLNYFILSKFIKIYNDNPNPKEIRKAVEVLNDGGVIIYPTDSVYGMGCSINKSRAVERIAFIKGQRPEKAHFSFIFCDLSQISEYTKNLDNSTFKLLKRNLPGPFTFILEANSNIPKIFKAKKKTIGIRVPNNNIIREIVKELGHPIMTTSVLDDDEVIEYTTDPELILEKYRDMVDLVIDGGYGNNEPSTVVDCLNTPRK